MELLKEKGNASRLSLSRIQVGQRRYDLKDEIEIQVTREGKDYICQDEQFGLYGVGATFSEAYQEYCEAFDALYKDYVETDDSLSEGSLELADRLRALVNQ